MVRNFLETSQDTAGRIVNTVADVRKGLHEPATKMHMRGTGPERAAVIKRSASAMGELWENPIADSSQQSPGRSSMDHNITGRSRTDRSVMDRSATGVRLTDQASVAGPIRTMEAVRARTTVVRCGPIAGTTEASNAAASEIGILPAPGVMVLRSPPAIGNTRAAAPISAADTTVRKTLAEAARVSVTGIQAEAGTRVVTATRAAAANIITELRKVNPGPLRSHI